QYGTEINVRISQFGVDFLQNFGHYLQDADAPKIHLQDFGYLYLADNQGFADVLTNNQQMQSRLGAGTRIMTPDQILAEYPFYNLDDIILGSHNPLNEGYFDGGTMFDWLRKKARQLGAEYIHNEVTGITRQGDRVTGVALASGETVSAGIIINASGPRGAVTARMAGLDQIGRAH